MGNINMICNNCNTSIPDEVFAVMKKTAGDNVRCFGCGFLLTEPIDKKEEYFDYNIFPYPLALVYERYVKGIQQKEPPLDILISIKDFVEVLVKYATIVQLSFALNEKLINPSNSSQILQGLARPSLGTWVDLLGVISKIIKDHYCNLNTSHEILNIYDSLFNYNLRKADKKHEQKDVLKSIWDFVTFRNNVLGHGAKQSNVDYLNYVNKWNSVINKWEGLLDALSGIKLLIGQSKTNIGITCRGVSFQVANNSESNKLSISFSDNSIYCLSPFIFINSCDSCNAQLLFFYDSDKNYGDKNPKINSLEYHGGHKSSLSYPVIELEEIFGEKQLLDSFKPIRVRIAEIDSAIIKAPELIKKHANIIGRDFLKKQVNVFLKQRAGIFILTALPGMGKTAFSSFLIANGDVNAYFIYRRTSSSSSSDDFTKSTYYSLLQAFGIVDKEKSDNILELRVKLKNLLSDISGNFLRKNEKCVILVDALDEGTASRDGISTIQAIPFELPDNIFFILTSRPLKELDEIYVLPEVIHYSLEPLSNENIEDGVLFLTNKLSETSATNLDYEKIVKVAEGNFLLLQLITESIQTHEIDVSKIEIEISRMPGLSGYYSRYWEILIQKCGESRKDINLLSDILGLMSISRAPLKEDMIIATLNLTVGDFIWALRQIRQFVDIIEEKDEKYLRLFHDTFRDFVKGLISSNEKQYHKSITNYFKDNHPKSIGNAYAFRHKAFHLAAAGDMGNLFEWITNGIEDKTHSSRQMILQILDDLKREPIQVKKASVEANSRTNEILEKLLSFLNHKEDEFDVLLMLLNYIKSYHSFPGVSVYFSYKLREFPTPIAESILPLLQEKSYYETAAILLRISLCILKYHAMLLICHYSSTKEYGDDLEFKEKLYRILQPGWGDWVWVIEKISNKLNLQLNNRSQFSNMSNKNEKKSMIDVFVYLTDLRNESYGHGVQHNDDKCKLDCDLIISELDILINHLTFFENYKLVQVLEENDQRIFIKTFIGEDISLCKTEWIYLPNEINEESDFYIILPNNQIVPFPFCVLSFDNSNNVNDSNYICKTPNCVISISKVKFTVEMNCPICLNKLSVLEVPTLFSSFFLYDSFVGLRVGPSLKYFNSFTSINRTFEKKTIPSIFKDIISLNS